MHQDASAPDREHYFWIDALRGGAAIIVLISHVSLFGLYGYEHVLAKWPPTRLLWAGHQAVILFFVISGFALYLLFEQMAAARGCWLKFIMVRFLRLYPPYLASLLLALLVLKAAHLVRIRPLTRRACHCQRSPDGGHVDRSSPDEFDVEAINPPIWTLVHEARLSLLPADLSRRGKRRPAHARGARRNLDRRYLLHGGAGSRLSAGRAYSLRHSANR